MLMSWLLKFEGYPPSVVVALLLHGFLLWLLLPSDFRPENMVNLEAPSYISATVAQQNPQKLRRIVELERQRRDQASQDKAREEARARDAARAQQEREQQELAARQAREREEAEKRQQAETQARQQQQQKQQQEEAAAVARREEEARQAAARSEEQRRQEVARQEQAAEQARAEAALMSASQNAEMSLVAQYTAIIREIISSNWSVPPSARNGMTVVINLQLVPTGEVIAKSILQSSGDAAFDRAALQAVEKAGRFPELRDLPNPVFERNFRNFNLLFRPEDLLL